MTQATDTGGDTHPLVIALSGTLSLAVAMGIGRFAFTPLMPMMLHDGLLNLASASWLASANYFGYLLGAILCTLQPAIWSRQGWSPLSVSRMVRAGLLLTCLLTALMAIDAPAAWPWLRFIAGVVTAVTFVYTSTWCLGRLSRMNLPSSGGDCVCRPGRWHCQQRASCQPDGATGLAFQRGLACIFFAGRTDDRYRVARFS